MKNILQKIINRLAVKLHFTGDKDRQKNILDILLSLSIGTFAIINVIRVIDLIIYPNDHGLPIWSTLLILIFLLALAVLSRYNQTRFASILLIFLYSLPALYSLTFWGADLPAGLLLAVLVITMSAALLGASFAFGTTFLIISILISLTWLQNEQLIIIQDYWRQENNQLADAIVYSLLILIIAGIAWLFAHGIKQTLARVQASEQALKDERDSLEIKVIERTKELRLVEREKISQLSRFAELGKLSSGIFHDLINPLTAVSLNLEQICGESEHMKPEESRISHAKICLNQALLATHRMEKLLAGVKKQLRKETGVSIFNPSQEIAEIIEILAYKARRADVTIELSGGNQLSLTGDAVKFGQIIINLLANAIDASENLKMAQRIIVMLDSNQDNLQITIKDEGAGIAPENMPKIFEPFFSTKKISGRGLGIGLSLTKDLIEDSFGGSIRVSSQLNRGTIFLVLLPINHKSNEI